MLATNQIDDRETAKAALYNSLANLIMMVVGVIMIPITTRILPTEDMGIAVSFTTMRNICMYLFTLSIYSTVNKGMLDYKDKKVEFLSSIILFTMVLSGAIFLIYLPFGGIINRGTGFNSILIYWLFISVLLLTARMIGMNYLLFHNKYITTFILTILAGPVAQFFSIYMISHQQSEKYLGRVIGLDLFNCIVGIIVMGIILTKGKCIFKWKYIKYAVVISVPLIPHLIAQTILTQSDILMIKHFEGASETGIYSMAYTIGTLLYTVLVQIMSAWSPWVYRQLDQNKVEKIYKGSQLLIVVGGILAVGLMTITPEMVNIFLDDSYREGVYIIPSIVIGMYFQFIYLFFYDVEYFNKKTNYIAISSLIAAGINILLNFIAIPRFGYMAAGYTTAIGYLILAIMHYRYMKKIDDRKIYDCRLMVIASIIVMLFGIIMFMYIDRIVIRYSIFVSMLLVIFMLKYKDILALLKNRK